MSRHGRQVVSIGDAKDVRIWDIESASQSRVIRTASYPYELDISPDGTTLCTGEHGIVRIWDFVTGTQRYELTDDFTTIYDVTISPDGKLVASGGRSSDVYVWKIETGERVHHVSVRNSVKSLSFSSDCKKLVICESPYWLHVLDLSTGEMLHAL
jgi:WD40 repeat protein